ncbi:MAG: hypothetical protein E7625_00300 [Ruminococcaceae bacterium]|nr:hypothetical protein [Oscillospiraceae bacterium]
MNMIIRPKASLFLRMLALCLTLIMLLSPAMTACRKDPGQGDEDDGPKITLVGEDGVFRYTIIRSLDAKKALSSACATLHAVLEKILDRKDVEIITDDVSPYEWEILVGNTNRPESAQVKSELGEGQYAIRVMQEGKKIVIVGCDDEHTVKAIDYFLRIYADYDAITGTMMMKENISLSLTLNDVQTAQDTPTYANEPTLVHTRYTTEDVVVADIIVGRENYAVDPTGTMDSAPGIQLALNDCAARGGGTVFLPAGNYRITSELRIPAFTVLRGDWQDPDLGNEYGTVIWADVASRDEMTSGTILLGASGGAYGLTVYYPDQSMENVRPYPFTFYFNPNHQGKGGHAPTVKNCTVINGYRGVGATVESESGHEQMTIENFKGTFLDIGVAIGFSSDVGTCANITVSPKYWSEFHAVRGLEEVDVRDVTDYTRKHTTGMRLSDVEWTEYVHITVTDCKTGIHIIPAVRIGFAGSFYDTVVMNCDTAVRADELDKRWGAQFSNCYLVGSEYAMVNASNGVIKTAGTTMLGGLSGTILVDRDLLSQYNIDTGVSYQKPNAVLYVADFDKKATTDISGELQALLNEAGKTGGVVYLPGGNYLLDQPITVPEGVELRGTSPVATREQQGYGIGTRIFTHYGVGMSDTDTALITLEPYAGVNGIRFAHSSNTSDVRDTAYMIRGKGEGVYVVNSCFIAAGRGIDFVGCDDHFIKKVTSFCFINDMRVGGKNGTITGFLHNATVCDRLGYTPESGEIGGDLKNPNYANRNEVARDYNTTIHVVDAEGQRIWNAFSYGVAHFIVAENSIDTLAVNIGTDNIGSETAQMVIRGGDFVAINVLRFNGHSYDAEDGAKVKLYSRLAIGDKTEETEKIG